MKNNNGFILFGIHFFKKGFKKSFKNNLILSFVVGAVLVALVILNQPDEFFESVGFSDLNATKSEMVKDDVVKEEEKNKELFQSKKYGENVKPLEF